jgi:predicted ArsR family transcriptional regulator
MLRFSVLTSTSKLSPVISGTRRAILECLLVQDANAVFLAEQLGINISAIRGHLDVLEIAGLVSSRHEQAKRGRPKRIYSLTPLAYSLFPTQTTQVFSAFIQAIIRSLNVKTTNSLIRQMITSLWHQILPEKPSGILSDQLSAVVQALDTFGFYASLESTDDQFVILIHNDVFRPALQALHESQANYFRQEFWKHLKRMVEGIEVQIAKGEDPGQHGLRVFVEERKE